MPSETENWYARQELSQAIREAWKAGLEVEDRGWIECPTLVQGPRVFFYDKTEKVWKATLLCIWIEDRQFTRFYTFLANVPPFVKVA